MLVHGYIARLSRAWRLPKQPIFEVRLKRTELAMRVQSSARAKQQDELFGCWKTKIPRPLGSEAVRPCKKGPKYLNLASLGFLHVRNGKYGFG